MYIVYFFHLIFPLYHDERDSSGRPAVLCRKRLVTVPQNYHLRNRASMTKKPREGVTHFFQSKKEMEI